MTGGGVARQSKIPGDTWLPGAAVRPRARRGGPRRESAAVVALWHAVASIPPGQASTYGDVARAAGLPGRARLAGFALRTAPASLHLPWHRVVAAGGRIAFPKASRLRREQERRLRSEGVRVTNGRVAKCHLPKVDPP